MHSMFTDRESVTSIQLRDTENKWAVPMPRTNYLKNSFSYSGAVLWNSFQSGYGKHSPLTIFERAVEVFYKF
jgi:hypothetical protein